MKWKKWDIPGGIATVAAAVITVIGGLGVYLLNGRSRDYEDDSQQISQMAINGKIEIILNHLMINLGARRVILFKITKPIRKGHEAKDIAGNSLLLVMQVDGSGKVPTIAQVPYPLSMADLPGNLDKEIAKDFLEFPNRQQLHRDSLMRNWLMNQDAMALLAHHVKNGYGDVVAIIDAQYTRPHKFTNFDRKLMKQAAERLALVLIWLDQ